MDATTASTTAPTPVPSTRFRPPAKPAKPRGKCRGTPRIDTSIPVRPPKDRDYTTGQAARFLRCSQQTVIRMADDGRIPAYRIPGSKFRRIPAEGIRQWLGRMGLPVPAELATPDLMAPTEPGPEVQG